MLPGFDPGPPSNRVLARRWLEGSVLMPSHGTRRGKSSRRCGRRSWIWVREGDLSSREVKGLPSLNGHVCYVPGTSQLQGRDKKVHEARRVVELGGKVRGRPSTGLRCVECSFGELGCASRAAW
jgi:hypothetical protein